LRSNEMGSCGKTCRRACWLNLEAHPAQDESEVSLRICSRDIWFTSLHPIFDFRFAIEESPDLCRGDRQSALGIRK
jgi:hypothetical protein